MQLAVVLITFLISFATGLLVFHKNSRSATNFYFSLLIFFIGVYPIFNYLAINSVNDAQSLFWAKMILLVSIPQGPLLYFFARSFPSSKFVFNKRLQIIIICWAILNLVLASLGLIFKAVTVRDGVVSIEPGPLVPLFGLLHAGTIIAGITVLHRKYKHAVGMHKDQLTYVFYGVLVSFSLTFLITLVLPIFLKNTLLLEISPLFLALAVGATAYAIISRKLFDIRYVVVRATAYTLTRLLMTLLYTVPLIMIIAKLMGVHTRISLLSFAAVVGIVIALFYDLVRKIFDALTNRLFFRRYYEPQEILDRLSEVLVRSINADYIKRQSIKILQGAIRTKQFTYRLVTDEDDESRYTQLLTKFFKDQHGSNILIIDEQDGDPEEVQVLNDAGIALAVRLRTTHKDLGFLTLGFKESGERYIERDKRLLSIAADEIAISLQNAIHFEEIQAFNRTLQSKVEEATRALRRNNERLQALDETKDDFISMASHQLRTPLTSVKGYISMVLEGDAGKLTQLQTKMLNQALVSSQRMVYLIADLLNVSRLRTGKFVIEAIPTDLATMVKDEVAQLEETAATRNIKLNYEKPRDFPQLMLDETKIRQVIMNFIDNAIYYTPSGGQINIKLLNKQTVVELRVEDNGIGVPKSDQHHLFTKFYRATNARRVRPDGTGLGLFMAKKVVVAQGGAIIFESKEGAGSTFGFTFPLSKLLVGPNEPVQTGAEALVAKS